MHRKAGGETCLFSEVLLVLLCLRVKSPAFLHPNGSTTLNCIRRQVHCMQLCATWLRPESARVACGRLEGMSAGRRRLAPHRGRDGPAIAYERSSRPPSPGRVEGRPIRRDRLTESSPARPSDAHDLICRERLPAAGRVGRASIFDRPRIRGRAWINPGEHGN